jgi:diacylglycerol kinase (ATP)
LKTATLIYNLNAGSAAYSEKELVTLIEENGYKCRYLSTKNKWKKFYTETDLIIVAGGDGTVQKVIERLLDSEEQKEIPPLAILPLGTANNITKTLKGEKTAGEIIASWKKAKVRGYDVGIIKGISKPDFFLESFGFGIFPSLMKKLKKEKHEAATPRQELKAAQQAFWECIKESKPHPCRLTVDGKDLSGKYLSVEIMNTTSIGPNITLAPSADMADGLLDVVLISEKNKKELEDYLLKKTKEKEPMFPLPSIKAKEIGIRWKGTHAHADGELVKLPQHKKIKLQAGEKILKFLI